MSFASFPWLGFDHTRNAGMCLRCRLLSWATFSTFPLKEMPFWINSVGISDAEVKVLN